MFVTSSAHGLKAAVALLALVTLSVDGGAATQDPQQIPQHAIKKADLAVCAPAAGPGPSRFTIDARELVNWIVRDFQIDRDCIDGALNGERDGDDLFAEKRFLLADSKGPRAPARFCNEKKFRNVSDARDLLRNLVRNPQPGFQVRSSGAPTPGGLLGMPGEARVEVFCMKEPPTQAEEEGPPPFKLSEVKIGGWQLKLRGDQDSLPIDRSDKEKYKKATAAKFSIVGDELKDRDKYDLKVVLGLDSGKPVDKNYRFIPYVKYERNFSSPQPKGSPEVDNLTLGLLAVVDHTPVDFPIHSTFTFDSQYLTDSYMDSSMLGMTLRWYPTFTNWNFPGGEKSLSSLLFYQWHLAGIVRYSEVFDPGQSATLALTNNFLYAGPEVGIDLYGYSNTLLESFKLSVRYHYLAGLRGPFNTLERFLATLSYQLDKDGDAEISLSYDNGRDYEKLDRREEWKAAFGYKF